MLRYILVLNTFTAFCGAGRYRGVGPDFPATKGEVWPKPQHQDKKKTVLAFHPAFFEMKVVGGTCPLLKSAVARYTHLFAKQGTFVLGRSNRRHHRRRMVELRVNLTGPCEDYPYYGMHETYYLTISKVSNLQSSSIWGILRGLQTVVHSFYLSDDFEELLINATDIIDFPRFSHRGILLDTSRHFISLQNILLTLEAMEMNKMNVLHWHIVDDESFPYESQRFPELSEHGAYHSTMVYTKADIKHVVKFARRRGIRVIPEFDVPGHTLSWGVSHPEILTKCNNSDGKPRGVLNPVRNATFDLLGALFKEVQNLFPDKSFHLGGDEVFFPCWDYDPTVTAYMNEHRTGEKDLYPMFMHKLFEILGPRSQPVVWQEVFENINLPRNVTVQIWKFNPVEGHPKRSDKGKKKLNNVIEAGYKAILSSPWYLDYMNKEFRDFYLGTDPSAMVVNQNLVHNVLGGEACMWGETIDDRNVISRIWPRASATAEILWSSPPFDATYHNRLEEHTCRMIRYDIGAQPPNGRPGVCVVYRNHLHS